MYPNGYMNEYRKRLKEIREKKKMLTQAEVAEAMSGNPEKNRQKISRIEHGTAKRYDLTDAVDLCNVLDVDLDYLFGITDTPSNEVAYISDKTGLDTGNVEKLREYSNKPGRYNALRLNAINMILSSEKGLQIIEAIAKYLVIEPEYLMVETRGGASSSGEFAVIASSAAGAITINKDDIPAIYLTAITKLLTEWKDSL